MPIHLYIFNDGILDAIERGSSRLREDGPRDEYSLILRFNRTVRKGVNLFIGDLVTSDIFGNTEDYQVRGIRNTISHSGGITVSVELGALDGRYWKGADEFQQVINRQDQIAQDQAEIGESM